VNPSHPGVASAWVVRWAERITPSGRVLDVACGGGRHALYLAGRGFRVDAVDRDAATMAGFSGEPGVTTLCADLEAGPWLYAPGMFSGVVVTNYLHRPLFPHLLAALAPGGILIYETFAAGNERHGRPRNPDFLLAPGELLDVARGRLQVVAYEALDVSVPAPAVVQRMCAIAPASPLV